MTSIEDLPESADLQGSDRVSPGSSPPFSDAEIKERIIAALSVLFSPRRSSSQSSPPAPALVVSRSTHRSASVIPRPAQLSPASPPPESVVPEPSPPDPVVESPQSDLEPPPAVESGLSPSNSIASQGSDIVFRRKPSSPARSGAPPPDVVLRRVASDERLTPSPSASPGIQIRLRRPPGPTLTYDELPDHCFQQPPGSQVCQTYCFVNGLWALGVLDRSELEDLLSRAVAEHHRIRGVGMAEMSPFFHQELWNMGKVSQLETVHPEGTVTSYVALLMQLRRANTFLLVGTGHAFTYVPVKNPTDECFAAVYDSSFSAKRPLSKAEFNAMFQRVFGARYMYLIQVRDR